MGALTSSFVSVIYYNIYNTLLLSKF
jgi:hypothetical protein